MQRNATEASCGIWQNEKQKQIRSTEITNLKFDLTVPPIPQRY